VHDPFALHRRQAVPAVVVQRGLRRGDRPVHILVRRIDDVADDLARRGIFDFQHLVMAGIDPFAVDEKLRLAREEFLRGGRIFPLGAVDGGHFVHLRSFPESPAILGVLSKLANWRPARHCGRAHR